MTFLMDGDLPDRPTVLLAHGAGAAMDSGFMTSIAAGMADCGLRVARFEFAYMAGRRTGGSKRPPPKVERLQEEFLATVDALTVTGPLIIGGKSMGGRVASLVADDLFRVGRIAGLLCLGYPFHPTGKPQTLRTTHLEDIRTPTLICRGTRDAFGTRAEVEGYGLSEHIDFFWLEDGDHDLKPRKSVTGTTQDAYLQTTARACADWIAGLGDTGRR